ncbi:uroporphyrinogen-III synthase [Ancylobacter oerskovii]|uniref:Uroporphyrinogen-III synthase n=1 Tax=Ancylobacter oerskovii TaxID=459519 RepID=A0ABW4YSA0_9HYPH|nr:uroporphyrinogen-III synthase [Ancylobacter oerskovii]MBS7545370.1 uroporphyrinogen-III synthase [Ancylobacter oerskovii]
MRVLVTRPQPDAAATAARLAAAGHEGLVDPMLAVEAIGAARLPDGRFDALALTSVNGARALGARAEWAELRRLPLYTVGWRTAQAAPEGATSRVAGGDGAALAELLRAGLPRGARLLHVCGEDRAVDLGAALADEGIAVELFTLYRAVPAAALSPATIAAARDGRIDVAFHFSPRTAATLAARATEAGLSAAFGQVTHLCFSAKVAAPLEAAGWPVRIAAAPNENALFALLSA